MQLNCLEAAFAVITTVKGDLYLDSALAVNIGEAGALAHAVELPGGCPWVNDGQQTWLLLLHGLLQEGLFLQGFEKDHC